MNYTWEMGDDPDQKVEGMARPKACIKKHETCGHRDWDGNCTIHGCILSYKKSLTIDSKPRFRFNCNQYDISKGE